MATYYVDATGGSDSNAGTSEGTAWQTIAKVIDFESVTGFAASDSILLKRGEIFYVTTPTAGVEIAAANITFGAYGTGDKPVWCAGGPDRASSFSDAGGGVWSWAAASGNGVWNNALWEDSIMLTQKQSVGELVAGSYFYDETGTPTYYYYPTTGVPTDHFVTRGNNLQAMTTSGTGVTVENIHFRGTPRPIEVFNSTTINNCDFTNCWQCIYSYAGLTDTVLSTNNTFTDCFYAHFCESTGIGNFHDNWTVGGSEGNGNIMVSTDQNDLTWMYYKNVGSFPPDYESFLSGQNMRQLDCSYNGTEAQPLVGVTEFNDDESSGVAAIIALWCQNAANQMVDPLIHHNHFGTVGTRACGLGAPATNDATTGLRVYSNEFNGSPVAIKCNVVSSTNNGEVFDNNIRNAVTGIENHFAAGVNIKRNSIRASAYFVSWLQSYTSGDLDENAYYGSAQWQEDADGTPTTYSTLSTWATAVSGEANSFHTERTVAKVCEQDFRESTLAAAAKVGNTASLTRGDTNASLFDSSGDLGFVAGANDPRLASYLYDGASWNNKGLLIEGAFTNEFSRSEELDNAAWSVQRASVTANDAVAPDGTTTAEKLVEDSTASNTHYLWRNYTPDGSSKYIMGGFFKADERNWVYISIQTTGFVSWKYAYFNVSDGSVGTTLNSPDTYVVDVGNGWYFCGISNVSDVASQTFMQFNLADSDGGISYNGDGSSGMHMWGLFIGTADQLNSYVKTTTAAATRAAEDASVALNINSPLTGVFYGTTPPGDDATDQTLAEMHGGDTNDNIVIARQSGALHVIFRAGGAETADLNMGAVADDTDFQLAFACDDGDFAASLDGGAIVSDAAGNAPDGLTTIELGQNQSNANHWFGHIERMWAYDERKANAWLQSPDFSEGSASVQKSRGMLAGVGSLMVR